MSILNKDELNNINKLVDEVINEDNLYNWDNLSPFEKAIMMKKLIKRIDNSIEEQKEREKYTHSLEEKIENQKSTLELYCKNYGLQKDKIEKQSKVIDEMATAVYDYANLGYMGICEAEAENGCIDLNLCEYFGKQDISCLKCIKQYFYRKVEEDE